MKKSKINPQFPLYIVSKGRAEIGFTWHYLDEMGVPYFVVIEAEEYNAYAKVIDPKKLLVRPDSFVDAYNACMPIAQGQSKGSGPSRNYAWEHALSNGHEYYWVMDDNIKGFYRINHNSKIPMKTGAFWRFMEDFVLRYENIYMAGPHYFMFCQVTSAKVKPPLTFNTRVYSCNLIKTRQKHRWRGRYNEDTILSLDILKAGFCTVLFNGFVQNKMTTQKLGGGNMIEIYKSGTLEKSQMLVNEHPDVARLAIRYKRAHHHVDFSRFKSTKLIKRPEFKNGIEKHALADKIVLKEKIK